MTDDKGFAEAQRYPGGIEKFLFDTLMALDVEGASDIAERITTLEGKVEALEEASK